MERRANPGEKRREGTSLLRGIMHCGVCGERMYTFSGRNGQLRYRCIGPLKYRQRAAKGEEKPGVKCYGPTVAGVTTEEHVTEQFLAKYGHLSVMRMVQEVGEDFRPQIRQAEEALADLQKDRYDRGLFRGDDGAIRYAEQYAKLEERLAPLKERQRTAKPGGVKAEPTGETHAEQWKRSDVAGPTNPRNCDSSRRRSWRAAHAAHPAATASALSSAATGRVCPSRSGVRCV
ncbi:zinc ribbon domain-containing protein [Streptomyces hebeiensis]